MLSPAFFVVLRERFLVQREEAPQQVIGAVEWGGSSSVWVMSCAAQFGRYMPPPVHGRVISLSETEIWTLDSLVLCS
ncbi:hypothetical protein ACKFKH_27145 [Phormidesmis sp. 146-20]